MKFEDFVIGNEFICGEKRWRCTDIGKRVIVAICLDDHDEGQGWFSGPPYIVAESVFDEYDMPGCRDGRVVQDNGLQNRTTVGSNPAPGYNNDNQKKKM